MKLAALPLLGIVAANAQAQPELVRAVSGGGGGVSAAGAITLNCTITQHDAGLAAAGELNLASGFWPVIAAADPCPADFNGDHAVNTLDVLAFLNAWAARDPRADFNHDGAVNTLDVLAFLNAWAAGC